MIYNFMIQERYLQCNWNKTWTQYDSLDECVWVQCLYPPDPPPETLLASTWTGDPVDFNENVSYVCPGDDLFFEWDRDMEVFNISCLTGGTWDEPTVWPICLPSINCTDLPPERPASGTWEWNGLLEYDTSVKYTCGPYGNFESPTGEKYSVIDSVCAWNKSWTPNVLDPCVAASCQVVPFPPPETGMIFLPDPENPITLQSEFNVYNPRLPFNMKYWS